MNVLVICTGLLAVAFVAMLVTNVKLWKENKLLNKHLDWSYDQHMNSLESLRGLVVDMVVSLNTKCKCDGETHARQVYGIEELITARWEWIKTQWRP